MLALNNVFHNEKEGWFHAPMNCSDPGRIYGDSRSMLQLAVNIKLYDTDFNSKITPQNFGLK